MIISSVDFLRKGLCKEFTAIRLLKKGVKCQNVVVNDQGELRGVN